LARPLSTSDSAIRKDLKVPEFIQRGKVLIVRRQYQEAVKVCRLGLLAHPTYIEGRLVLGMALMALSRHDEVLGEMRVALELAPENPMAHLLKGEALYHKRDFEQSLEVLERARELDPLNEKARKLLDEIDDVVNYGGEMGPRAKTETKVYPAQQAHEVAFGEDPSEVLGNGGFSEWDSGVEMVDSTLSEDLASQLANDETEQIDEEESDTDVDDPNLTAVGGDALSGVDPDLTALGGDALDMVVADEVSEVGGRPISDRLYEDEAEEEDEYTTAPFLPPTHMAHNLPPLDGTDWSDSTITDDSPKVSASDQMPPDERTEEKIAGGYEPEDAGQMSAVILEDQTQEVEQADEDELGLEEAGDPDWATPAPEPALDEDDLGDLDDEEPTWVPGEYHDEPAPLGEIGAYDLSHLEHDEPTVVPGASDMSAGLEQSDLGQPESIGEVYDDEDEEDDTVVNADAPPPEALFGEDDQQIEAPQGDQDFLPRAADDATKAVDLDRSSGIKGHDAVELTPSIPGPDQVVYASGIEEVSDEAGTREIYSADLESGADPVDPYESDVQIITPPPDPAPLPPIGAVPSEESGIEELASSEIILAEDEPDDIESDISEISVEMLPADAGEMPPLPADDSSVFSLPEAQFEVDPLDRHQVPAFDISTPAAENPGAGPDGAPFDDAPFGAEPPPDLGPYADPFGAPVSFDPEPFDAVPYAAEPFDAAAPFDPAPQAPAVGGAYEFNEPFEADESLPELGESGDLATRVKFEMDPDGGYDPRDQLDPVQAGVVDSPDIVDPPQHATFAFEPGAPEIYPAEQDLPGQGFADPARPLMPQEPDEDELSLEPADQSGEQDWQMPAPMRTAAMEQDDGRAYPYDDPYPLDKPPTVETRPGGPLGLRGGGKPVEAGVDGMLQQMTGESGLFRRQANSQRREDEQLHRRRVPDGTATSWINILVGEPGSHRWIYLVGAALGVLALAVAVGLAVRYYRLGEQIHAKRSQAKVRLQAGNMRDFMSAAQSYADILARRSEDGQAHGMHARILAAIPFEFGDPLPGAEEQRTTADTEGGGADRAAADIYANLYGGSLERAAELVIQARKNYPESPVLPYLQGRVSLLEGNAAAASMQLEAAHKLDPKDAVILRALGDSLAAQGMSKQALAAYDKALAINKDHIASHLGRARLRVANRQPPIDNAQFDLTNITVGKRQKLATRGQKGWAHLILARLVLNRGQMDLAKRHIRGAQAHKPARDPLFQDELAGVLIDASMLGDAEKAIRESKQLMKGRPHPYYHMARIHLLHGRPKAALTELSHAKGLQYAAANVLRARIYVELGRYADANKEVDRALGMAAGMLEAHIVKAKVLTAQKQGAAAESKLQKLLREHPKDARLLTAYGEIYMQMGKLVLAREKFRFALKLDKHAYGAQLKLAEVHMAQGDFKDARKRLAEAHRNNPGNIMILSKLAAVEFDMGELTEAAMNYNDAKKRAPNNPGIRLALARVYTEQRRLDAAAKQIGAAEARQPEEGALALAKGRLKLAEGKAASAVGLLAKATNKLPENAEAWDLLVQAHLMNNDESQARSTASTMLGRLEKYPEAEAALGRVVLNQGQSNQAVRRLNSAIKQLAQYPRPPRVKAMIHVLLGRAYQDSGSLSKAAGQYDEAASVCQPCPEPYYRKGLVQDERGETSAAMDSLRKALKHNKRYMEVYYDLGQVYEGAGQKAEAKKSYKKYLSFNPPEALATAAREAIQNLQ
jgi:tetratricopeptide (TPR) repeat protein